MMAPAASILGWLLAVAGPDASPDSTVDSTPDSKPDMPTSPGSVPAELTPQPAPTAGIPELPEVDEDAAKADQAWERGAEAYQRGDLDEAIEQFRKTYRYSGSPGPLFSLGQAHRHQHEATGDDLHRRLAIQSYRAYIELAPEGARRPEAMEHIARLQTKVERELEGIERPAIFTGISVTADALGARVSVDGAAPVDLPAAPELDVGAHHVVVEAPGYRRWSRRVQVSENSTVAVAAHLEPLPATLLVEGPPGADLYVDGARVARLPMREGLAVAPGRHQIGIARTGRTLYVREIELGRGESRSMRAELEMSGERKVAIAAITIGSASLVATGVLGGLTLRAQSRALGIEEERDDGFVDLDRELDGRDLQDQRDRLRAATIGTAVGGAVAVVAGVILYLTDEPPVASQLHAPGERPRQLRAGPDLSSTRVGFHLGGRF